MIYIYIYTYINKLFTAVDPLGTPVHPLCPANVYQPRIWLHFFRFVLLISATYPMSSVATPPAFCKNCWKHLKAMLTFHAEWYAKTMWRWRIANTTCFYLQYSPWAETNPFLCELKTNSKKPRGLESALSLFSASHRAHKAKAAPWFSNISS